MGEGSNFKYGEKSVAQQGTNMNSRSQHITTSSNDTQPSSFSFGFVGNSSNLTPILVAGYSEDIESINNKGEEPCKGQLQNQQQSSQQVKQASIEMQNWKNGQHNIKGDKQAIEQVQGGEGRQKEKRKNNYI